MPVVTVDPDELRELTGRTEKTDDELKTALFALGMEFEGRTENGEFELEFAPDRLDRLSVEGVARSLSLQYGDSRGISLPSVNDPDWTITVDESVPDERPCLSGAVVRDVDLDEDALDALIQLQEKLHQTMGRKRAKGAIGIHDLTMLKGTSGAESSRSVTYRGVEPEGDSFVPLESDAEQTPETVLREHPTGQQYADLVSDAERYPAIDDDIGMFSFPPVINGRRTKVDTASRDLFVELTGTDQWTIDKMCTIVCYALAARGGQIEAVTVEYPDQELRRPEFAVETKQVGHQRIEDTLGIELSPQEVIDYFERAGLDAAISDAQPTGTTQTDPPDSLEAAGTVGTAGERTPESQGVVRYDVEIPPYRVDIRHPVDLVDDVGRAYGFNDLEARYPDVSTIGTTTEASRLEEAVRTQLVGLGFEDMLTFHLIGDSQNFERMGLEPGLDVLGGSEPATIAEPYSEEFAIVRTWVLPSLLMVLSNNTHRRYPQDLLDIGFVAGVEDSEPLGVQESTHVAGVLARHDASYEDAKAKLQTLARRMGCELETPSTDHPTFIDGRTAKIVLDGEAVGVVGELDPAVLTSYDLELPVVAFEFDLEGVVST